MVDNWDCTFMTMMYRVQLELELTSTWHDTARTRYDEQCPFQNKFKTPETGAAYISKSTASTTLQVQNIPQHAKYTQILLTFFKHGQTCLNRPNHIPPNPKTYFLISGFERHHNIHKTLKHPSFCNTKHNRKQSLLSRNVSRNTPFVYLHKLRQMQKKIFHNFSSPQIMKEKQKF